LNVLVRKISALEQNVLSDKPDPKETYLYTTNKIETELFKVANKIIEKQTQQLTALEELQKLNPNVDYTTEMKTILELSKETETIVSQAEHICLQRAIHIFDKMIAYRYHLDDSQNKFVFYLRFFWFLSEMQDMFRHSSMENKIMGEQGFFDLCKGDQDKKLKVCYDSWREWFSKESFEQWLETHPITPPNPKSNEEANEAKTEYASLKETEL
jgi:hypothetical protein